MNDGSSECVNHKRLRRVLRAPTIWDASLLPATRTGSVQRLIRQAGSCVNVNLVRGRDCRALEAFATDFTELPYSGGTPKPTSSSCSTWAFVRGVDEGTGRPHTTLSHWPRWIPFVRSWPPGEWICGARWSITIRIRLSPARSGCGEIQTLSEITELIPERSITTTAIDGIRRWARSYRGGCWPASSAKRPAKTALYRSHAAVTRSHLKPDATRTLS